MTASLRALVTLGLLALPASAHAWDDDGVKPLHKHRWPTMYNRLNYWAPNVYRIHAYMQPIGPYIIPVNTAPDIVPQYRVQSFRIPPIPQWQQPYYPNLGTPETAAPSPGPVSPEPAMGP